jgi:maltooligosyltrehalose trehalohydrolase
MRIDYDETQQWIVMHRGGLAIACNLGTEAVDVPVTGEVVLAWDEPAVGPKSMRIEGHSFAIVKSPSTAGVPVDN